MKDRHLDKIEEEYKARVERINTIDFNKLIKLNSYLCSTSLIDFSGCTSACGRTSGRGS